MAEAIAYELREQAEEMYVVDGLTLDGVSASTRIPVSTLKKWSADECWKEKRQEYRQALSEIRRNTVLLRKRLIAKALTSLDSQDVYAVSRLESATKSKDYKGSVQIPDTERREIKTQDDAVSALQEAIENKLNVMLSSPGELNLAGIRDMKKIFELMDEMKARYQPSDETRQEKGLSDETVEEIKKKILGLT